MTLEIRKLSYALGAEIKGVDISKPLSDENRRAMHKAFLEHCVLLFRGQSLTRQQHAAFSAEFGTVDRNVGHRNRHPATPEVTPIIRMPAADGKAPTGRFTGQDWHTDHSHLPDPCTASLLHAIQVPGLGGDTMFCNMY